MVTITKADEIAAMVPVLQDTGEGFFFTPVRSDREEYTGLAIVNTGAEAMEATIKAYASSGTLLDTTLNSVFESLAH